MTEKTEIASADGGLYMEVIMRYIMLVLLTVGFCLSANPKLIVKPMVIDDGTSIPCAGHGSRDGYVVDESTNQLTLVGIEHECIAYNAVADAIGVVNRSNSTGGILNFHSANGALSFWIDDFNAFSDGGATYPMAIATAAAPYMSFRWVTVGGGTEYCSGGWFSSAWDPPISMIGTNIMGCYGKELPNGNMCFILYGASPFQLYYRTYTADLGILLV